MTAPTATTAPTAPADRAAVVALSGLPRIGPARLGALVDRGAAAVWEQVTAGRLVVDAELAAACAQE